MTPPTTTRRLMTTILLIMMLTTSLAHPISRADETDREAVSINQSIQIFTSPSPEPYLNYTTETRVLNVLERVETRLDDLIAAQVSLQTQQDELAAALVSLQSKQDEFLASAEPHLNHTTETLERIETRQDELSVALASLQAQQGELTVAPTGPAPRDCSDVLAAGHSWSGVYLIQPINALEAFRVYCDMTTDGGGWTVFQRRQNGDVDFFLDWNDYKVGFGDIEDEFWIGNDVLHLLTNGRVMQLRVDLWSFDNETAYAEYSSFSVSDESDYYRLEVGGSQGTAGDSMVTHNGQAFSTRDADHETYIYNCATSYHGAWWYNGCWRSNLNGRYYIDGDTSGRNDGIMWHDWKGDYVSMKKTEMKVRPL